ncbi:MAG: zinc ribbon domain-containing protein [Dehalococcoidales bacterium]|nr:zinc ribbon domain-containing protein [Dehalococcoidales bacterium]
MPIYEYECESCGMHFERKRDFSSNRIPNCPKCKGKVRQLICAPAIVFKGSGFYVTDSRSNASHLTDAAKADKVDTGKKPETKK